MKGQTTDATPKKLGSYVPAAGKAGILFLTVTGFDGTDAITGQKAIRFKKNAAGTLTLGTAVDVVASVVDAGLGAATFAMSAVSNKVDVMVTGAAGKNISWVAFIDLMP